MSLRYGVLGSLAGKPASGYDLARRFEEALGSIWPAKHPQIYGELAEWAQHIPPAAERSERPSA
jgi:DNA-binding PadR family transcriptional regulator